MYTYIFDGTDMNIRTPNLTDFSLVKKELISQTASKIVMRLTYPDGLEFTVEQEAKRTTVYSTSIGTESGRILLRALILIPSFVATVSRSPHRIVTASRSICTSGGIFLSPMTFTSPFPLPRLIAFVALAVQIDKHHPSVDPYLIDLGVERLSVPVNMHG